jgi:hypothetical protein
MDWLFCIKLLYILQTDLFCKIIPLYLLFEILLFSISAYDLKQTIPFWFSNISFLDIFVLPPSIIKIPSFYDPII